ncbi:hypothetical protein JQS43_10390 [Natronosporangium hydrolyticum]|uniref:Rpn family recombination-promoting nuclease/putative transposase n=1 Tax=Natronosporangium hydrolyticum TaxID=2811111 RepID=A0A895YFJ8_9ACTN|nr:hypothetical protein [Natronosporangium hydrolyticum]QSB16644.1 hypothetical protein JQS43_10390 [Natronosporangium hydrolyticum]
MPSAEHETPIALAKLDPGLVAWLLTNLFDIKIPDYHHARTHPTDVRVMIPRTYHADGMLVFCDPTDQPIAAVVLEVQRGWDQTKHRTWPLYVAQLQAELDTTVALLVYCPNPAIAGRYRDLFTYDGISLVLRPLIFTPEQIPPTVDTELAKTHPALAVLATLCHTDHPELDATFPALAAALETLGPKNAILYHDIVLAGLPQAPRLRWEAFMTTAVSSEYRSELFREIDARGQAAGEARGEAKAILTVLDARSITIPDDLRNQILACTDLDQLDTWLRRAGTATTADDLRNG